MTVTMMVRFVVVQPQQINTKIVCDVSPDRMDMVRVVLGVIILHKEKRTVQPIVVWCLR